ncbi:hypothetical protein ACTA71_011045 [Dictyostelium dimigraforme]
MDQIVESIMTIMKMKINGASVLTFSIELVYCSCNFNDSSGLDGEVFRGTNSFSEDLETVSSRISDCTFSGGSANNYGGVIYSSNIPISIANSKVGDVSANIAGGLIYIIQTFNDGIGGYASNTSLNFKIVLLMVNLVIEYFVMVQLLIVMHALQFQQFLVLIRRSDSPALKKSHTTKSMDTTTAYGNNTTMLMKMDFM